MYVPHLYLFCPKDDNSGDPRATDSPRENFNVMIGVDIAPCCNFAFINHKNGDACLNRMLAVGC